MPRFTVSHHTGARGGDHYDLFVEHGEILKTWRLQNTAFGSTQPAQAAPDHRALYLDYEGEIADGRGRVKIWDTGACAVEEWQEERVRLALAGLRLRMRLLLQKRGEAWVVGDAAAEVKRAAASFLRRPGLEEAPSAELSDLPAAMGREERKILALVDRYSKGAAVEWPLVETDAALRDRIEKEHARWRHPWLAAAREHIEALAALAALLRQRAPLP